MTVEAQTIAPCRQKLVINATAEETRGPYNKIIADFTKYGQPPGFRAGKAPRHIIERHYQAEIKREVNRSMVGEFYRKAVKDQNITAIDIVDVDAVLFSPATGLSFTVTVDVAPEFKLPKYTGVPVTVAKHEVSEADVTAQVDRMRNIFAERKDVTDRPAEKTDLVTFEYEATADGQPLAETLPNLPMFTGQKEYMMEIGKPDPLPQEFDKALTGATIGETAVFDVKYPKDFAAQELAGKKVNYTATVKGIRSVIPLSDEDFLKRLNFAKGLDAFKDEIRADLEKRAEAQIRRETTEAVFKYLDMKCKFELPKIETANETNRTVRSMVSDIMQRGGTQEEIVNHRDDLIKQASDVAERRLRLRYILARIADEEKIETTDKELNDRLTALAMENRQPVEKVRAEIESNYGLEALRQDIRIDKANKLVVDQADVKIK